MDTCILCMKEGTLEREVSLVMRIPAAEDVSFGRTETVATRDVIGFPIWNGRCRASPWPYNRATIAQSRLTLHKSFEPSTDGDLDRRSDETILPRSNGQG